MTDQIQKEREQFEDEIKQLSQQQNIILHERECMYLTLIQYGIYIWMLTVFALFVHHACSFIVMKKINLT